MKSRLGLLFALALLSGCVYGPGYYARPGVVYDDGTTVYAPAAGYAGGYYGPGYYGDPWCCYGGFWPWVGLNFYGGYGYGHHHWHDGGHGWRGGASNRAPRPMPGAHGPSHGSFAPQSDHARRH